MEPYLRITVKEKEHPPHSHLFQKPLVVIGKQETSDIFLNHPLVSRQHALVRMVDDNVEIEDLQSTNGSLLNDQPITTSTVTEEDAVHIGPFQLSFKLVPHLPLNDILQRLSVQLV